MKLRQARDRDVEPIMDLEARADLNTYLHRWDRPRLQAALTEREIDLLVAEDASGQTLGYAIIRHHPERVIELIRLTVAVPGRGTGSSLLAALLDAYRSAARIWLDVYADNDRARRVYERAGFALCAEGEGPRGRLLIMDYRPTPAADHSA